VYLTDDEVELVDKYIQEHFMELKKQKKANRSAVVRMMVRVFAKEKGFLSES